MDIYKVIVAGGRDFKDYKLLKSKLDVILANKSKTHKIIIVSGNAEGADKLGEKYADERGYDKEIYPADWNDLTAIPCKIKIRSDGTKYNCLAGFNRNKTLVDVGDSLVAFWNGSNGTASTIKLAKKKGIPVRIIKY